MFFYSAIHRHSCIYIGDCSGSSTTEQEDVDFRVQQVIDMEDPEVFLDLRAHNHGQVSKYDEFWEECRKFLNEDIGTAVDDRRHGQITHLARAISVRDLVDQVKVRCPSGIPIPSIEWVRLQFWPKTPSTKALHQHTSRFTMKFMIQQRQWRKQHPDAHYAAACFRYLREYSIKLHEHCLLVCVDEPDFPVASAERGRRVPVRQDEFFLVGDHDFTKFGLIPSVIFVIDIPEEITDSWYRGK